MAFIASIRSVLRVHDAPLVIASLAVQAGTAVAFVALSGGRLPDVIVVLVPAAMVVVQASIMAAIARGSRRERLPTGLVAHMQRQSASARRSVMFDDRTGLYHAWYLQMRLEEEAARCDRYGLEMALIVLRVGRVGLAQLSTGEWDGVADAVARSAARSVRSVDMVAALGPMEFGVCLVHAGRDSALAVTRRLLDGLGDFECSVGSAVYPEDGADVSDLVETARASMTPTELPRAA